MTKRIGACPRQESSPANFLPVHRAVKRKGGLVLKRGELAAERAIKSQQWPGFDVGEGIGKIIFARRIPAGTEKSLHETQIHGFADCIEGYALELRAIGQNQVCEIPTPHFERSLGCFDQLLVIPSS